MKTPYSTLLALALCGSAWAQSTTPPPYTNAPTVTAGIDLIREAIANGQTNWLFEAHGLYAPQLQKKYGGGIGIFFPLSQYVFTGIRLDYVDGGFYMPSGNAGLQLPMTIPFINTKVTPFGYAGIGVPLSGATIGSFTIPGKPPTDNNGQATAILGLGGAIRLYTSSDGNKLVDLAGDIEQWSGFPGNQYRGAIVFKWSF